MARVYTRRFFSGSGLTKPATVVPAGKRWILRDIVASSSAVTRVDVYVPTVGYLAVISLPDVGGFHYGHWEGRQALNAGDSLTISSSPVGAIVVITGYEFDA